MQHNLVIFKFKMGSTILASNKITKVANVANFRDGATMSLVMWVVVRSSGLTAFNKITY